MDKILIANRGEIALRVMRSAREMGIKTVAVFSDADRQAPHVLFADEAAHLGEAESSASYLDQEKVLAKAAEHGVDAIHPGYGFLSENAAFAGAVQRAGLIFIGPPVAAMEIMGSKLDAKEAVSAFDVPLVPGSSTALADAAEAKATAAEIGYPVLLKAAAGGGGKGMRIVREPESIEEELERAQSEAQSAFGDPAVFIERYIESPRHVEIQVLADSHGHIVHLFERECSIQRRHQKVIEESPSPAVDAALRARMGEAAIQVAKSCGYVGAGTVEFLLDEKGRFYFIEMNTRLQVEHAVTEALTGVDLVKEQIRIARGEQLSFTQDDLQMRGHAIELRVYAEDPYNRFLPDIGTLETYRKPEGPGVRVDDGYREGMEVPIYYDPMLAKLICHGRDRDEAIGRMLRAIEEYEIKGVRTTLPFGAFVMRHAEFQAGNVDTHFIERHFQPEAQAASSGVQKDFVAQLGAFLFDRSRMNGYAQQESGKADVRSRWRNRR